MKKVGILGGTFDPPHIGHLFIAEEIRLVLGLSEVWFIPSYGQPHKDQAQAMPAHRLEMVKRAIASNPHFTVNPIEINRLGKSYTFDTIKSLKKKHPTFNFYFIIGADMVEYLPKWYNISELIQQVTFVGVTRPGYTLHTPYPIKQVEIPRLEISSSMIRKRLANGQQCRYILPDLVQEYIKEHELYGTR